MDTVQKLFPEMILPTGKIKLDAQPVQQGDTVVGTVTSSEIKSLYGIREKLVKQAKSVMNTHEQRGEHDNSRACQLIDQQCLYYNALAEVAHLFLWIAIHKQFPVLYEKMNVDLREKWQVVWTKNTPEPKVVMTIRRQCLDEMM